MKALILGFFLASSAVGFAACSSESGDGGDGAAAGEGGESGSGGKSSGTGGSGGSSSTTGGTSAGGSAGTAGAGATGGSASGGGSGTAGNGGSGQSGSGGTTGPGCDLRSAVESCDDRGSDPPGGCTEYYDAGYVPNQMCPVNGGMQGEYSDGPCPRSGALGYCHHLLSGVIDFALFHYEEETLSIVMSACPNSGGTWCAL